MESNNKNVCSKTFKQEPVYQTTETTTPQKKRLKGAATVPVNIVPIAQIKIEADESVPMMLLSNCETCKAPIDPRFVEQNLKSSESSKEKLVGADINSNNASVKKETDSVVERLDNSGTQLSNAGHSEISTGAQLSSAGHSKISTGAQLSSAGHSEQDCSHGDTKQAIPTVSIYRPRPTNFKNDPDRKSVELPNRIKYSNSPAPFRHRRWHNKNNRKFHPYYGSFQYHRHQYTHFSRQRNGTNFNENRYNNPGTNFNKNRFNNSKYIWSNSNSTGNFPNYAQPKGLSAIDSLHKKDVIVLRITSSPSKSCNESGLHKSATEMVRSHNNNIYDKSTSSQIEDTISTGEKPSDEESGLTEAANVVSCSESIGPLTHEAVSSEEEIGSTMQSLNSENVTTESMIVLNEVFFVLDEIQDDSNETTASKELSENERDQEASESTEVSENTEALDDAVVPEETNVESSSEMPGNASPDCVIESNTIMCPNFNQQQHRNEDDIEVLKEVPSDNDISCVYYKYKELHVCACCFVRKRKIKKDTDVICLGKGRPKTKDVPVINLGDTGV